MRKVMAAALSLPLLAALALPAYSQQQVPFPRGCGPVEAVQQRLVDNYGERVLMSGELRRGDDVVGEFQFWWNGETGTTTAVNIVPHPLVPGMSMACMAASAHAVQPAGADETPAQTEDLGDPT